ncbi:MAG: hypothetical protein PHH19_02200 [Eubacteriales bacterium]|nr:hypothetical protein [Eubacteriales bacterium]
MDIKIASLESETQVTKLKGTDEALNLLQFEENIMNYLRENGLPTSSVLVPVQQRLAVFRNIPDVLFDLDPNIKTNSLYLSKFIAAVASGLFDAALNYLWDETINELRNRVAHYDLNYFYDNAVTSQDKRKKLKDESDLVKIDDSELIHGSKEIGLISDLGFKHLDYIRYMRNWASAAHPNQNELTGLQLVSWFETCKNEVISLPLSISTVEIKKLLVNMKGNIISEEDAKQIASFFTDLTQDQTNTLVQGLFGIYCRVDSTTQSRENIHMLLPYLWGLVDEQIKNQFGIKYGKFVANNDQKEQDLARSFLEVVKGTSYIPDGLRASEIEIALDNLLSAHRGLNDFYSEPPFARELSRLLGNPVKIPQEVEGKYIATIVEVFLTNGNGVAWNAEPIYIDLIKQFNSKQSLIAVLTFNNNIISSRLQFSSCQTKFREMLISLKGKITSGAVLELINEILNYGGPLDKIKDDTRFNKKIDTLQKIIG